MEEAILNTLRMREGRFVSGEELSRLVGVTRTAIWKEIQRLKEEGYRILAQPHIGYRLVGIPDRLIPQELAWSLKTQRIGCRIHAYERTDSTMDLAHRFAGLGEPEGTVVVAEEQAKGRGRLGRRWASPKGKGIYMSVILRPSCLVSEVPLITLMAAVAVAEAMKKKIEAEPEIKWPNDLLFKGKKVAGILTELSAELNRVHYVILGIGVNVNTPKSSLPERATSLAEELGFRVDRVELARGLLFQLDRWYDRFLTEGIQPILEGWRNFASFLGRRIRVVAQERTVDGQAVDVDSTGSLLVRTDAGLVESIPAGEVLVVR